MTIRELSVFVDESGNFGEYDYHCPFYIISLVLHEQDKDIKDGLKLVENKLSNIGWPKHCVHAGPLIRGEEEYRDESIETRQRIMRILKSFAVSTDFKYTTLFIEKKHINNPFEAIAKLSKQLSQVINSHMELFISYDVIKIYYDNGQIEVTKILSSVFGILLDNVEFKKVYPVDYRLFQVADLICTLTLTELKMNNHLLSKSDIKFFGDERTLKKNYLKQICNKKLR